MLIVLDFLEKNLKAKELLTSVITLMDVEREREFCLIGTAAVVVFLHEIRPLNSSYRAVLVAVLMVLHLWCQLLCIFGIHFAYYKEFMCEHAFTWNFFFKNVQNLVTYIYTRTCFYCFCSQ